MDAERCQLFCEYYAKGYFKEGLQGFNKFKQMFSGRTRGIICRCIKGLFSEYNRKAGPAEELTSQCGIIKKKKATEANVSICCARKRQWKKKGVRWPRQEMRI